MNRLWYYFTEESKEGPFSFHEIKDKIHEGIIDWSTEVYSDCLAHKQKLMDIEMFQVSDEDQPAPVVRSNFPEKEEELSKHKVRPVLRLIGRFFDYFIFTIFVVCVMALFGIPIPLQNPLFFALGIYFVWNFIEALLISSFGTTPGKFLIHMKILNSERKHLSYTQSLKRSFGAYILGFGLGIPFLSLATMLLSLFWLSIKKETFWDKGHKHVIVYKKIGIFRAICILLFILVVLYYAFIGIQILRAQSA